MGSWTVIRPSWSKWASDADPSGRVTPGATPEHLFGLYFWSEGPIGILQGFHRDSTGILKGVVVVAAAFGFIPGLYGVSIGL